MPPIFHCSDLLLLSTRLIYAKHPVLISSGIYSCPPPGCVEAYDLLISTSVLEHVQKPWLAAENMVSTIKPGGCLYVSVPWVREFHEFPNDYWRFSLPALDILFPHSLSASVAWSTYPDGALFPYQPDLDKRLMATLEGINPDENAVTRRMLQLMLLHNPRAKHV